MEYCNDFKYDLKLGQCGEHLIGHIMTNATVEVKTDLMASKTGNVFVEYKSRGMPSGISTSEAEWYAFIISMYSIRFILTSELKKKCRKYINTHRDTMGGDNNISQGILLPINEL